MDAELRELAAKAGQVKPKAGSGLWWFDAGQLAELFAQAAERCAEECLFTNGQAGGPFAAACVTLAARWRSGGRKPPMGNNMEPKCLRCGHPQSWHRHDDADNHEPSDPACPFRCLGYDCDAAGPPPVGGRSCDCPNFEEKHGDA